MINDFLYDNPEFYEVVFPPRGKSEFCMRIFEKYSTETPSSILDIGCGTGRDLADFSKHYPDCVGFDAAQSMVSYAKKKNPELNVFTGDMRSFRLSRTFDVICALGGCMNFALSNEDLDATFKTYQSHAHKGSLLLLQPLNPSDYFGEFRVPKNFFMPYNDSMAVGEMSYKLLKLQQVVERTRTWTVEGQNETFNDSMSYRIIFPAEISYFLNQNGFDVLDIFESDGSASYANKSMYVVARYNGC
ncbi:methyltransferase domain-containing protein [Paenibacillus algorifonticola]|uniref:class I SAM-dependent methyltransferase n=1 Tax=Paenibacillus algorifonticola TaxID=684063 RepID=UPI003D2D395E